MLKLISAIILAVIFIGYAVYKKESIIKTWDNTVDGFKYMLSKMKELGFLGTLKIIFDDIFKNRTVGQWIYLLILGFMPLFIELYFNNHITDWLGMIASLTGIICVIFVSEGRASNYFFGLINYYLPNISIPKYVLWGTIYYYLFYSNATNRFICLVES